MRKVGVRSAALLALGLALVAGCDKKMPPQQFPVTFSATSDGEPLEGVELMLGNSKLGSTGPDGVLHVRLTGREGTSLAVRASCPEGYRIPDKLPVVTLRSFEGLDPSSEARGVEIAVPCPPEQRQAVVVVRTDEPNLPVRAQGKIVAYTDAEGIAHALVRMTPSSNFRLVIDTSERPELRPQNPPTTLAVGDADEIFVVDQAFSVEAKKKPGCKGKRCGKKRRPKPEPAREEVEEKPFKLPIQIL